MNIATPPTSPPATPLPSNKCHQPIDITRHPCNNEHMTNAQHAQVRIEGKGRNFRVVNATTGRTIQAGFPTWTEAADYAAACDFTLT